MAEYTAKKIEGVKVVKWNIDGTRIVDERLFADPKKAPLSDGWTSVDRITLFEITDSDGNVYHALPTTVVDSKSYRDSVKKKALDKLTEEEKRALGLK